jgi:threonine dehydrogenase-like Zn-dependent dehydrogenase
MTTTTSSHCRAALFTNIETIEYGEISFPQIETPTDAILKITVAGICGSDLHPFHGREPCALGTAFGHECVGEIVSLGSDVTNFDIGDLVSVPFSIACGKCFYCAQHLSARCQKSQLLGLNLPCLYFSPLIRFPTGWKDDKGNGIHGAQVRDSSSLRNLTPNTERVCSDPPSSWKSLQTLF